MKANFHLVLFSLLLFSQNLPAKTLDLADAIKKGYLSLTTTGTDWLEGKSLRLRLENKSKQRLEIRIPAGQIFEAADTALQNLMVGKEELLTLESGKVRLAKLFGFCIEAGDGSPGESTKFNLGKMAVGNLLKLAQHISDQNLHTNYAAQCAVWAVANDRPLESIGDPALAKFTAELLGKPVPTYNFDYLPQESRLLPGEPADLPEAVSLNGLFYYDLSKDQKVDFGLYDSEGKLIHALFNNQLQKRGAHKFKFTFKIKGLPKGKYAARLMSEGKVLEELAVEL
ncbi:MAG: hypothetical protein AAB316_14790 [Bacteroidota bacterium]